MNHHINSVLGGQYAAELRVQAARRAETKAPDAPRLARSRRAEVSR